MWHKGSREGERRSRSIIRACSDGVAKMEGVRVKERWEGERRILIISRAVMWTHQGLMHSWWKYEHASNIAQTQEAYFVQDYNSLTGQKFEFLLLHVQKWQEQTGISFIFILSTEISHLCAMHTRIWALFSSLMKILWIHTCTFWTGLFIFTWVKKILCFLNFYCHPKNNK